MSARAHFVLALGLFVALSMGGNWLVAAAHIPLPGSVLGMLVLTALIELRIIPLDLVRDAAGFLVRHLALLYVPAGVAIVVHVAAVRRDLLAITIAGIASLLAVLLVVGVIVQRAERDA